MVLTTIQYEDNTQTVVIKVLDLPVGAVFPPFLFIFP